MDSGNQTLYIVKECNFQPRADIGVNTGKNQTHVTSVLFNMDRRAFSMEYVNIAYMIEIDN